MNGAKAKALRKLAFHKLDPRIRNYKVTVIKKMVTVYDKYGDPVPNKVIREFYVVYDNGPRGFYQKLKKEYYHGRIKI